MKIIVDFLRNILSFVKITCIMFSTIQDKREHKMTKATYKCPECGNEIVVVDMNRGRVAARIAHMENWGEVCFACKCKQKAEKARQKAVELNLPELEGSPKQIAWAETIRISFLKMNLPERTKEWMLSHTSARFFIDNREPYQMNQTYKESQIEKSESHVIIEQKEEEEVKPKPVIVKQVVVKPKWRKFEVNIQNIKYETERSFLISMPHSSDYDGFTFWIGKKLCRGGSNSYAMQISVTDTMEFKLQRKGKNGNILEEKTLSAESMIGAFGGECNFNRSWNDEIMVREEIINHVPETLIVEKVEVDATLVR